MDSRKLDIVEMDACYTMRGRRMDFTCPSCRKTIHSSHGSGRIFSAGRYVAYPPVKKVFVEFSLSAGMLSPPGDPFVTNTEREIIILFSVLVAWGLVRDRIGMHTPPCVTFQPYTQVGKFRNQTLQSSAYTYRPHRLHFGSFIGEIHRSSGESYTTPYDANFIISCYSLLP